MTNDSISDMLTRIRNANFVKHQVVQIQMTQVCFSIAKILKEEGFILDYTLYLQNKFKYILISLKYTGKFKHPVIQKIERISKPGLRQYANSQNLPIVLNNFGIAILSTSKGIMTNLKAKELGIGGEILCYIW